MARYAFLWTILLVSTCYGQLTVKDNYDPYEPIVAGCNCIIPENGQVQFMWQVDPLSKSLSVDTSTQPGAFLHIWAPPGQHSVEAVVVTEVFRDIVVLVPGPKYPDDPKDLSKQTVKTLVSFDVQRYQKSYTVGKTPIPPPVNPDDPIIPVPTDDFAKQVQVWLKAIPAASYSKAKALSIADNYTATAAQAVATTGWDLNAFVTDTKQRNYKSLTAEDVAAWATPFFSPLAQYQATTFATRKLTVTDVQGIAQIWKETAEAIRKAAF